MSFSLAEATTFFNNWKDAYLAVTSGKGYTINTGGTTRSLTRQDADSCLKHMNYWQSEIGKINSGKLGIPTKFVTPNL